MTAPRRRGLTPGITIHGEMVLGGLRVELAFADDAKGAHASEGGVPVEQTIVPPGQTLSLPRQPVLAGVGGEPFIWIKLTDDKGRELSSELSVGRCVHESRATEAEVALPVTVTLDVGTSEGSKEPGPSISLEGSMQLPALHARLNLRNSDAPLHGARSDRAEMSIDVLLWSGQTIRYLERRALGSVGGSPGIWLRLLQGNGEPIGARKLVGRCVEMSK